jgi:hypothetical protein
MPNDLINSDLRSKAEDAARYKQQDKKSSSGGGGSPLSNLSSLSGGDSSSTASSGDATITAGSYKRGGKVKKTGRAKVHKGERVLTKKQAAKYTRMKRGKR